MKHLKIYFAILVFCFLGSTSSILIAQPNKIRVDEVLATPLNGGYVVNNSIKSQNGKYRFTLSENSMYIQEISTNKTIWSVDFPYPAAYLNVNDRDIVVWSKSHNRESWKSECFAPERDKEYNHLQIQNDGNLVFYAGNFYGGDGDAIWATGTCGGVLNGCGSVGCRK